MKTQLTFQKIGPITLKNYKFKIMNSYKQNDDDNNKLEVRIKDSMTFLQLN